jgi:hypothetical protein
MMKLAAISFAFAACSIPACAVASPLYPAIVAPADPVAYRSLTLQAKAAFDARDYAAAERLYRDATARYPLEWQNWRYLAASLRLQEKWRDAIPAYARLVELSGAFIGSGRYWQAVGHAKLGELDAAFSAVRAMIDVDHEINKPALATDENLKPLWGDPRFKAMVSPQPASRTDRIAGWRGDLAYLVAEIHRLSPNHRGRPLPAETQALVERLHREIPTLSDQQIFVRLSEVVGSLHQNHTMFWGAAPGADDPAAILKTTYLPVQFYAFREGIFVVAADEPNRNLIGGKVEAIGGVPIAEAVRRVRPTMSFGSEAEFAWTSQYRLVTVPVLEGLGLAKPGQPVEIAIVKDGRKVGAKLAGIGHPVGMKLGAPPGATPPRFLAKVDNPHWFELLPGNQTIYAQFNQVADGEKESIADYAAKLRAAGEAPGVESIILDMRHNNGGNTFLYPELVRTLVAFSTRPGARLYVLIGRNVYSAAGNFATDLERFANPVFVGEPTGNMGNQEGDEAEVVLPYSHLMALVAGVKWQLSHPWDERRSIVPHVPVALSAADYFAGRDPVLDTTLELIAADRAKRIPTG